MSYSDEIIKYTSERLGYNFLSNLARDFGSPLKDNKDQDNVWIIDPIDGTINFLHGIPHFSISIALKSKNEIISLFKCCRD